MYDSFVRQLNYYGFRKALRNTNRYVVMDRSIESPDDFRFLNRYIPSHMSRQGAADPIREVKARMLAREALVPPPPGGPTHVFPQPPAAVPAHVLLMAPPPTLGSRTLGVPPPPAPQPPLTAPGAEEDEVDDFVITARAGPGAAPAWAPGVPASLDEAVLATETKRTVAPPPIYDPSVPRPPCRLKPRAPTRGPAKKRARSPPLQAGLPNVGRPAAMVLPNAEGRPQ